MHEYFGEIKEKFTPFLAAGICKSIQAKQQICLLLILLFPTIAYGHCWRAGQRGDGNTAIYMVF